METVSEISVIEAAFGILFRGGWVLAPIFALGWFGWFLMIERYGYYFMLKGGSVNGVLGGFWKNLEKKGEDEAFKKLWPTLKEQLREQVYPFEKMQAFFKVVGAPYDPSMIGITRHQLHDMFPIVQLMRWRYNVLDLAKRGMFYDELVESIFKPGAPWDLTQEQEIK